MCMEDTLYVEPGRFITTAQRILLPVDGSEIAARAATVAYELCELTKAKLYIVHVINLGIARQIAIITDEDELEILEKLKRNGQRLIEGYKAAASKYGIDVELIVEEGLPSDRIVSLSKEHKIDIIVMGSKGISAVRGKILGSTTQRVVRKTACPVLIVK